MACVEGLTQIRVLRCVNGVEAEGWALPGEIGPSSFIVQQNNSQSDTAVLADFAAKCLEKGMNAKDIQATVRAIAEAAASKKCNGCQ